MLTADRLRISSLILTSFGCPDHGQAPGPLPPCWFLMNASCSLLKSPRIVCGKLKRYSYLASFRLAMCTNIILKVFNFIASLIKRCIQERPDRFGSSCDFVGNWNEY